MYSTTSSTYFDRNIDNLGYYHGIKYSSIQRINGRHKMQGVKRVIIFCCLIVVVPSALIITPLYLRHTVFADVIFPVTESDIIEIRDGISSIFCEQHSLRMNSSFNAFQLKNRPEVSTNHKHIRLKKSMTLPDDTLEYWGFYLLKGAVVELKVCSRYDGSRILVVKGERNLKTCGLLEHNQNKVGAHFAQGHDKVIVTFETAAEVVLSGEKSLYGKRRKSNEPWESSKQNDEEENQGGEVFDEEDDKPLAINRINNRKEWTNPVEIEEEKITLNSILTENVNSVDSKKTESVFINSNLSKQNETDVNNRGGEITAQYSELTTPMPDISKRRHSKHYHNHTKRHVAKSKRHIPRGVYHNHIKHTHDSLARAPRKHRKRDVVYNRKISHGGNALNFTAQESGSISSFENSLLSCYDGQILLAQGFPPSQRCTSVRFFETGKHMMSRHDVVEDGYYYYIFYSDNDLVQNDIHAVFDIYKPTFEYANLTDALVCLNSTNCTFPIHLSSEEVVVVEVPTRDGIEHEEDDVTYLISTCHPRMAIYMIFPISVLVLILSCAFI